MKIKDILCFICGFFSIIYFSYNYEKTRINHRNEISNYKKLLYEKFQYESRLESELDICNRLLLLEKKIENK